jgi:hypothetical protein
MGNANMARESATGSWRQAGVTLLGLGVLAGIFNACHSQPTAQVPSEPAVCAAWLKQQGPLLELGMQALKLGRIDPGLYDVDPNTKYLRLVRGLSPEAPDLQRALDEVNRTGAGAALAAAHAQMTQHGALEQCPATTYSVTLNKDTSDPSGTPVYGWSFNREAPSREQLTSCFAALYAPKPPQCDSLPLLVLAQSCAQPGYTPEPEQANATPAPRWTPIADIPSTPSSTPSSSFSPQAALSCHGCNACFQHGWGTIQDCHLCF